MNSQEHYASLVATKYTPDIALLELNQFWLVFVCDNVMRAGKNYNIISEHSARAARGFTQQSFTFYKKRTTGVAIPMEADQPNSRFSYSALKIKGEVHAVEPEGIRKLDVHYENGVQFRRTRKKILYPTTPHGQLVNKDVQGRPLPLALQGVKHFLLPERVDPIECWMYVGMRDYWNDIIDGGFAFEPVPIRYPKEDKPWLPKYYHYQNRP